LNTFLIISHFNLLVFFFYFFIFIALFAFCTEWGKNPKSVKYFEKLSIFEKNVSSCCFKNCRILSDALCSNVTLALLRSCKNHIKIFKWEPLFFIAYFCSIKKIMQFFCNYVHNTQLFFYVISLYTSVFPI